MSTDDQRMHADRIREAHPGFGEHLLQDCQDVPEHFRYAEMMAIPKCLSNRVDKMVEQYGPAATDDVNVADMSCDSAYCPRCAELRRMLSMPEVMPNAWIEEMQRAREAAEAAETPEDRALIENAERTTALMLAVNMVKGFELAPAFASSRDRGPGPSGLEAPDSLCDIVALAESIRVRRKAFDHPGITEDDVDMAMGAASSLMYRGGEHVNTSFIPIAHYFAHYVSGQMKFERVNPDAEKFDQADFDKAMENPQ